MRTTPAQAAPHMATQWGPPARPISKAVAASVVTSDLASQMMRENLARLRSDCR